MRYHATQYCLGAKQLLITILQCCGHPSLLTEAGLDNALADPEEEKKEKEDRIKKAKNLAGKDVIERLYEKRFNLAKQRCEDEKAKRDVALEECSICTEPIDASAVVTPCNHVFCKGCIGDWLNNANPAPIMGDYDENERGCPSQ